MPSFIVIESSKETDFNVEARSVLQSEKYSEINQGTYMGTSGSPSTIKTKLKNLPSYKKNKSVCNIKIYSGNLTA